MAIFLILQAHSTLFEVGLFSNIQCIALHREDKKYSSRNLIPSINSLLHNNNLNLTDIAAIGINQGPGPFTSLRTALTTVNGLSFATGIPLIGHNSLEALLAEFNDPYWPITIALLNAYNFDLYYAIQTSTGIEIGCSNSSQLFSSLKERFKESPIRFLGNGVGLYRNTIEAVFDNSFIVTPLPEECSLQQLAKMTNEAFHQKKDLSSSLLPHYLKDIAYTKQI